MISKPGPDPGPGAKRNRFFVVFNLIFRLRRPIVVVIHAAMVCVSFYLAFVLRFQLRLTRAEYALFSETLPWVLAIRLAVFIPFRLYQGMWRYTGIWDVVNIGAAVLLSSAIFAAVVKVAGPPTFPSSIYFIDAMLTVLLLTGGRLGRRIYRELGHLERGKRLLIYGAGDAGEMLVRDMRHNPFYDLEPVGFIDDDPSKTGQRIHDVPVLGSSADVPAILEKVLPDGIVIAMPKAGPATIRKVLKAFETCKVQLSILPNLHEVLSGRVSVNQLRNLALEDLLARPAIDLERSHLSSLIAGKRIMVTGAGGSIGSELCRQIAELAPAALVLFERYENSLYAVNNQLAGFNTQGQILPVIGDVTDRARLTAVMRQHRPQLVFHAAAHKHVPLMEYNPCEAIKNNVAGTRILAQTALDCGVEKFVLISTDKAVKPASIMGATKRVGELIVQALASEGPTCCTTVRFGNVLGSNGSVVPRFLEQIGAGGPVTVTHPEMRRFFMLIPEAVQLVLHAAWMAKSGSLFILEMGDQINIADMARQLIRLSGFVPEEEVPIVYTGLRPGEKLFEELLDEGETAAPSGQEKILRVGRRNVPDPARVLSRVQRLEECALREDFKGVLRNLCELVPNFRPVGEQGRPPARVGAVS